MKPISIYFKWITRRAGGIFLGIRISFPTYILYADEEVYKTIFISLGFIFFAANIEIRGKRISSGSYYYNLPIE